jgi:DMSO/TMAO reductase YedYZ molybdopterin-dependent catalytic subunit
MANRFVSHGSKGRGRQPGTAIRLPPGQRITPGFPVLSAGPIPRVSSNEWTFSIEGLVQEPVSWSWEQFLALPAETYIVDIHCVTTWSKLDTEWKGVSVSTLFEHAKLDPQARYAVAACYGGYTTNLPLPDLIDGRAFVAYEYDGKPLAPEHGGPARLVVPHLYFWKSAKWVHSLRLVEADQPGYWESRGYHNRGDPWKEERYGGN